MAIEVHFCCKGSAILGNKQFGSVAARALTEARKKGRFSSVADIKKRASAVSKTNIELLREHGCLADMTESDQMELFT